ncbi:DUF4011 domain-containing protein [Mycoplasma nasistruthionis]|uniref:DUF4011 domain-containing protein n=1 Tax=Mycoplasma nasistruthionis TaxID=353852 RepID=A0A5B7XWK4_9MOLU|nr:DUF4011 domain-containing protein [Mycoplasma nasistruthionis]QCZ36904.1 DUF4011 domain-containing protein [Mycoplasma nasistruthionis]
MDKDIFKQNLSKWKDKLIDYSLRNKFINYKSTKTGSVRIVYPDVDKFLDYVDNEVRNVHFYNLTETDIDDIELSTIQRQEQYSKQDILTILDELNFNYAKNKDLVTNLTSTKLEAVLRNINKAAKLSREEFSVEISYFCVGFLKWYESPESSATLYSPLFFIPTVLTKNPRESFSASLNDLDYAFNLSLIRKLELMFGISLELKETLDDENKQNTSIKDKFYQYIEFVKQQIQKVNDSRWEVIDNIELTNLSFSNINMLNDMEQNEDLILNSKFFQSFTGQNIAVGQTITPNAVDKHIDYANYYHILDSDSSQEAAIQNAINGQSFVLEGPPGTGKSQTITNIITELIARGKKVLFVAEKRAALEVVLANLAKIKLDKLVLPIHDINLNKKEVLDELMETLELGTQSLIYNKEVLASIQNNTTQNRDYLDDYYQKLSKVITPIQLSLYELLGKYYSYNVTDEYNSDIEGFDQIDRTQLDKQVGLLNSIYDEFVKNNFEVYSSIWWGIKPDLEYYNVVEKSKLFLEFFNNLFYLQDNILKTLIAGSETKPFASWIQNFYQLIKNIKNNNVINWKIEEIVSLEFEIEQITEIVETYKAIHQKAQLINDNYDVEKTVDYDWKDINNILNKHHRTGFKRFTSSLFSSEYRSAKKVLKNLRINKKLQSDLIKDAEVLKEISQLVQLKNDIFKNTHSKEFVNLDFNDLQLHLDNLNWYYNIKKNLGNLELNDSPSFIREIFAWANSTSSVYQSLYNLFENKNGIEIFNNFLDLFNPNLVDINSFSNQYVKYQATNFQVDQKGFQFFNYINSILKTFDKNLQEFIAYAQHNNIKQNFGDVFAKQVVNLIIKKELIDLADYSVVQLEAFKKSFSNNEKLVINNAHHKINENFLHSIPNINSLEGNWNEVAILRREANKSRNIMPIRKMFELMPNLIQTLKPCLMMSPLSVSSYFQSIPNFTFDVVIFDEASQVKVETSIGSMVRAKQWIIAGDRHQLPPTSFFELTENTENEIEYLESDGYESLLEFASGFSNKVPLLWHYRSKYEELIMPSNTLIYKKLITFPNHDNPNQFAGVINRYVNGQFIDNVNEQEAMGVVNVIKEIYAQFKNTKSVGVVCFNKKQQMLVENTLAKFLLKNPEYSTLLSEEKTNPFFVKNIETVQGDERDIIILSTCYGPSANGNVYQRFGPINSGNGYRRLNVATTRAKESTIVVTSLKPDDIVIKPADQATTDQSGLIYFKNYLNFARFGKTIDENVQPNELREFDSPFEFEVYNELIKLGYSVEKQVGCSGFKIDLAIVDPDNPNRFILGIECDGALYHSSKSARDRDRLRQQVLESKGWKIYRIWSTDWFKNKWIATSKLHDYIKEIIANKDVVKALDEQENTESEVEIESQMITKQVHYDFETYPDDDIEMDIINAYYKDKRLTSDQFLRKYSPVLVNEYKKFIKNVIGYTAPSYVNQYMRKALMSLPEKYHIDDKFIYYPWDKMKFRIHNERIRHISKISYLEIAFGMLEIIKISKQIFTFDLFEQLKVLMKLRGSASLNVKFQEAIEYLLLNYPITLKDEILTWNS